MGWEEVGKMGFWGDFQGLIEATGGGRGAKNAKIEATSFMDGPLLEVNKAYLCPLICSKITQKTTLIFLTT